MKHVSFGGKVRPEYVSFFIYFYFAFSPFYAPVAIIGCKTRPIAKKTGFVMVYLVNQLILICFTPHILFPH